jgi:hypothetical protein
MRSARLADKSLTASLHAAVAACERATDWMISHRGSPDALASAVTYLKLMGDTVGGWMLAKGADNETRVALARFYAAQVMTAAPGLADTVEAGAANLQAAGIFPG